MLMQQLLIPSNMLPFFVFNLLLCGIVSTVKEEADLEQKQSFEIIIANDILQPPSQTSLAAPGESHYSSLDIFAEICLKHNIPD